MSGEGEQDASQNTREGYYETEKTDSGEDKMKGFPETAAPFLDDVAENNAVEYIVTENPTNYPDEGRRGSMPSTFQNRSGVATFHSVAQLKSSMLQRRVSHNKVANMHSDIGGSLRAPPRRLGRLPLGGADGTAAETANSGDVMIEMNGGQPGVVVTTAPMRTGPPRPKPKLQRRKSLNPRMMTPPGLEILDNKSMVMIRQQMDVDIASGCGGPNTYKVWDEEDEQLFFATETSGCLCRWACGPNRRFSIDVFSNTDDVILNLHRTSCRCDCCCCFDCFLCLQKLYVVDCLGRTLGAVKQKFSVFNAKFDLVDHDNNVLYKIIGPCCPIRCCTELYFQVFNKTGERQIGRIQKKWGGDRTDSVNVDHEYFDVTFPPKLDSVDKALILGAAFLIEIMYMEMS